MDGETITSQVFWPFPKDEGNLSVDDGDQITAEDAYRFYTQTRGNSADSTWTVTKQQADTTGTTAGPDPLEDAAWHAKLDFNALPSRTEKEWRKAAKKLKSFALQHGRQFHP